MSSANYRGRGFVPRGYRPRGPSGPRFPPPNFASNRGRNVDSSHGWIDNHPQPWQQANRPQANHFEQKPWRGRPSNLWRGHDNQNRGGQNQRFNGRSRGNMPTSFVQQNGPARGFGSERGSRRGIRGHPRPGRAPRRVYGCRFGFGPSRQPAPPMSDSLAVPALGSEEERQQKIAETAYNLKQKLSTSTIPDPSHYWEQDFQEINNSMIEQPGTSNHAILEQQPHSPNLGLTSNNLQDTERVDPVPELTRVISEAESCSNEYDEKEAAATNTLEPIFESSDFNESMSWKDPVGKNSSQSTTPKSLEETELYLSPAFDPRGVRPSQNIIEHHLEQSHPTSAYYPHHMTSLNTAPPNHTSFIPTLPFNSSGSAMSYQTQNELQPLPMAFNPQYQATGCHSSNLVAVPSMDNRMISSGAINSRLIESSPNADLSNSLQTTGYAPSLGTTYNSSIHLPTAVPCIVRDLAPLPLMVTSTPSMLEPLPMPAGIFNISVITSTENHEPSVPLQKDSSLNMDDELDDMQEALKFAKTQLNMKCEENNLSSDSTVMPFEHVSPACSQELLPPSPKKELIITASPAPSPSENASLKLDSQPATVELPKIISENTSGVLSNREVFSPNSAADKLATNPIEVSSSVGNPPQVQLSTDEVIQRLLSTFIPIRQIDTINSATKNDRPAIRTDICKQPESIGSDVIVNGYKKTSEEKINEEQPKRQQLEQAVVKKSQNLVTRLPNKKPVLHLEARSMPAAGSSRKAKSSTPSDVNWKEKVISRFLKMSKNDIFNMVNSSGLRKFDVAMQHLVKEKKNSLSRERRNSADDMVKGYDMLREEFMSELGAMLDPSAVVDIENLPATFLQHLSEVLKLNDEPPLVDDRENSLQSRLTDNETARQENSRLQEDIDDIDKPTNKNTSVNRYASLRPDDTPNVNTTVTRRSETIVKLPKRRKAAKYVQIDYPKNVGETSLAVIESHQALPGKSSAKDSDRIVNRRKIVNPDPHTAVEECTLNLDSELFVDPKSAELSTRIEKRNALISGTTVTNSLSKSSRPMSDESIYLRLKKVERWNRQHCLGIDSYRNLTKEEWEEKYGKTFRNMADKESVSTHTRSISSSRGTSHEQFSPSPKSTVVSESSGSKKLDHINKVCYLNKAVETEPMQVFNNVNREDHPCSDLENSTSESMSSDSSSSSRKLKSRQKKKRKRKDSKKTKHETSTRRKKHVTKDGRSSSKEKLLTPDEIKKELPVKIENIKEECLSPENPKKIGSVTNVDRSKTTMTMGVDRSKKLALVGQSNKNVTLPAVKKSIQTVRKSYPLEIASTSAANTELSQTRAISCEPTQIDRTNISSKQDITVETNCFQSVALENKEILPKSMKVTSQKTYEVAKSPSRLTVPPEDKQKSKVMKSAPSISKNEVKKLPSAIESTLTQDKDLNRPETNTSNDGAKDSNDTPTFIVEHGAEMPTDSTNDVPSEQPMENLAAEPNSDDCFVVPNSVETQPAQLAKSGSKKIGIEAYKARILQRVTGEIGKTSTSKSRVQVSMENLKRPQRIPHNYKGISHTNEVAVDHPEPKRAAHTKQNAAAVQKNNVEARVHVKKSKAVTHMNQAKVASHEKQPIETVHKNEPETAVREEQQQTVVHEEHSTATVHEKDPKAAVQEEQPETVVWAKQPESSAHTNEGETVIDTSKPKVEVLANETESTVDRNQPKITVDAHHQNPHGSKSDPKKLLVGNSSTTQHTQKNSSSSNLKYGAKNRSGDKCATKDTSLKSETPGVIPLKPAKISETVEVGDQGERDTNKLNGHSTGSPSHRTVAPFTEHGKLSSKSSSQDSLNLICNSKKHSKRALSDKKLRKKHSSQERNSKEKLSTEQSSTIDVSVHHSWAKPGPLSSKKSSMLKKRKPHRLSKIQSKIKEYLKSNDIKTKIAIIDLNLNPVVRLVRIVLPTCKKSESLVASESEISAANVDNMLLETKPSKDLDGIQAAERSDDQETEKLENDSEIEVIVNSPKQDEPISAHTPEAEEPAIATMESETLSVPIDAGKQNTVDETTVETVNCAEKLDEASGIANNYDSRLPESRCISPTSSCNQQEVIETLTELPAEVDLGQEYYDSKNPSAMQYSEIDEVHEEISGENLANFDEVDMTPLPTEVMTDIHLSELEGNESIDMDIVEATGESTEFLIDSEMQSNSDQQCAIDIDKFDLSLQPSDEVDYAGICQVEPWITNMLHDLIDEVSNRWNALTSTEDVPVEVTLEPVKGTLEPVNVTLEPVEVALEPVGVTLEPVDVALEPVDVALEPVASNNDEISSADTGNQSFQNQPLSPDIPNNTDQNDIKSSLTTFELQIDAQRSEDSALEESANVDHAIPEESSNNDNVVADMLVINDDVTDGKLVDTDNTVGPKSPVNSTSPLKDFSEECIQSSLLGEALPVESIEESFDDISEKKDETVEKNELSSEIKNNVLESMTNSEIVSVITENPLTKDTEEISTDIRFGSNEAIDTSDSTNEVDIPCRETVCNEPPEKQSESTEEFQSLEVDIPCRETVCNEPPEKQSESTEEFQSLEVDIPCRKTVCNEPPEKQSESTEEFQSLDVDIPCRETVCNEPPEKQSESTEEFQSLDVDIPCRETVCNEPPEKQSESTEEFQSLEVDIPCRETVCNEPPEKQSESTEEFQSLEVDIPCRETVCNEPPEKQSESTEEFQSLEVDIPCRETVCNEPPEKQSESTEEFQSLEVDIPCRETVCNEPPEKQSESTEEFQSLEVDIPCRETVCNEPLEKQSESTEEFQSLEVDIPCRETVCNEPPEKQSENTDEFQSLEVLQPDVHEKFDWLQFATESKTLVRVEKDTNDEKLNDVAEDERNESDVDTDDSLDFENGEFIVVSEFATDEEGSIDRESSSRQNANDDKSSTRKSRPKRITNRVIQSIKYSSTSSTNYSIDETSIPKTSLFDPIDKSSRDLNSDDTRDTIDLQGEMISKIVSAGEPCTASINLETSASFDDTVNEVVPREEAPVTTDNSATAVGDACILGTWMNEFDAGNSTEVNIATESIEENTLNVVDEAANEKTKSSNDHEEMKILPCEDMPTEAADGASEMREEATAQLGEQASVVEVNEPCNNNTYSTEIQRIIDDFADIDDIDSNDAELQTGTNDDLKGHESRINRTLKGKTLYVKWDKSSVAANLKRSKSAVKSRLSSSKGRTHDRLYKSERKIKHKKNSKSKLAGEKVDEAMKSQEIVTTVKSQDVSKSMRKPTTKEAVMARMIEIDVEIHTLMSEKMKLYEVLESGSFSDAQGPPVVDDAELSGNVPIHTTPRCKTPVAIMTEIMNHLESDHTTTVDAGSTIISNEESAGESTKESSSVELRKLRSLRRKIRKREKHKKLSSKIEEKKLKRVESRNDKHEMIAKPILKKTNPVEKSAEDRSRSTVNWESDVDDPVNSRRFKQSQYEVSKKAAKATRDKKISRILVSSKNSDNCEKSRKQKQLKAESVLRCTLTNEEEEMPLDKLYNEILQRKTNSVGARADHLTDIINAVAEDKIGEHESSSLEPKKRSDVGHASANNSPPVSSSNEPATTAPNEKVNEYKKCETHDQIQQSVANAEDNLVDLQTFDNIEDLDFGIGKMIGSVSNASSANNNYNISQTPESVTERKSQDKPNGETQRVFKSEDCESLHTRVVKKHSFSGIPPIYDSATHSHCGSINLAIIEAGINALDSILGKVDDSNEVEKNIPTASFTDQDTRSKDETASADREVTKACDQIEDLAGESTVVDEPVPIQVNSECAIQPKNLPNFEDVRQRRVEDVDRNLERSHLRRHSAKNAREAITQQSAPARAVKSKERTSLGPSIHVLSRPNESNDTEDSRRRGKKRKMSEFEMANCKVRLIDCKYTYLKSRSFRRPGERSQVSRNEPASVARNSEKPLESIESNIDSNDFVLKNTNFAIRRDESLPPLGNENVNISGTVSKPEMQGDTGKRAIETDSAETGDNSDSPFALKVSLSKGSKADDSDDSQIDPKPRALRSFNKSKKAKIRPTRAKSSTLKSTNLTRGVLDQSEEITNCQPMIASEYLDGSMTQTPDTGDIPKVPTTNTEVEIVEELPTPRSKEIEKSNNVSLRCSGSADVIDLETPRIQYTAHKGPILDIKVFHDSFLAASEDGTIYRYSQKSDEVLNTYQGHKSAVTCMCIVKIATGVPKTELLFSGSLDASLRCFDIKSGEEAQNMSHVGSAIQCMDHAWGMIFLGTKTGFVSRFNVKNNSFKGEPIPFSKESVLALKATTEGPRRVLIAASRHQPITIRDAYDGLLVRTVSGHRTHTVYSLMMHNNLVYCGTSSTAIPVFDFINGSQVTLYNAGMGIVCIQMYQELLFAGCYDGNIYVFDTKEQKIVCSIPGPGNMLLSMGIVQNKLIAGSKDRRLHIWQIPKQVQTLLWRRT